MTPTGPRVSGRSGGVIPGAEQSAAGTLNNSYMFPEVREVPADPPRIASPNLCRNLMESFGVDTPKKVISNGVRIDMLKIQNIVGRQVVVFQLFILWNFIL